jgi:hypothetical protein
MRPIQPLVGAFRSHMCTLSRLLALTAAIACTSAGADGSYEPVQINRLSITNGTEYELVVTPLKVKGRKGDLDPYMGQCWTFTVRGAYSRQTKFPSFVTRDGHLAALAYLRQAHAANRPVNLGWMGTGFVPVDSGVPCTVRSMALHLHTEQGIQAVISYHDAL